MNLRQLVEQILNEELETVDIHPPEQDDDKSIDTEEALQHSRIYQELIRTKAPFIRLTTTHGGSKRMMWDVELQETPEGPKLILYSLQIKRESKMPMSPEQVLDFERNTGIDKNIAPHIAGFPGRK